VVSAIPAGDGPARPEGAFPLGLIWLKGPQRLDFLGLERALGVAAHIHKGAKAPSADTPTSAVICCLSGEDDLVAAEEVSDIRRIVASDAPVLVFALAPTLRLARAALRAGASGLIHSEMSEEQVLRAVSVAIKGEVVLPRELLKDWIDEQHPPDLSVLSARQREIMELVIEGFSNAEIARHLYLSESTIKQHLRATYKHLGVRNRYEAARLLRSSIRNSGRSEVHRETPNSSRSTAAPAQRRC
jgi:DNA-binding NarL/FixJ family response regulator